MTDRIYIMSLIDIIKPSFFEDKSLEEIVMLLMSYHNEYNSLPDVVDWQQILSNYPKDEYDSLLEVLREVYKNINQYEADDYNFVATEFRNFCRSQHVKHTLVSTLDYFEDNEDNVEHVIDTVVNNIQQSSYKGLEVDVPYDISETENIIERYTHNTKSVLVTGWDSINEVMQGGVPKGTLTIISAPTGAGKTWLCVNLAAGFQKNKYKGWHYSLELSKRYCAIRYDAVHIGVPLDDLQYKVSDISQYYNEHQLGALHIHEYPPKTLTISMIESELTKAQALGELPDYVIVDYAELMLNTNNKLDDTKQLGDTVLELRRLAVKFHISMFSPSQTNRTAYDSDIVRGSQTATAFSQLFHADHVWTYSRKYEDRATETARLFLEKNRSGKDKILFPCHHSEKTCKIQVYNSNTHKGQLLLKTMHQQGTLKSENANLDYKSFK